MPRQGVPYPSREICSLKCQIDALQRQINELMKSINGVQGDGQGNVSLVSGDPAVVINNDASQNQIEIALDQSELPAAAVRMVNGMTGAVVLAANDIYAGANTVGFEIADLKAENLLRKQGITNEISNRQAADAALQSNINAVSAGLPAAAAAAVAADPTVAQLVAADAQNVKLSGAQTVGGVKTFSAIPIVPTPAAGSTDGSVPNTNWISQTGDSGPNNLVHKTGNERKTGVLTTSTPYLFRSGFVPSSSANTRTNYHRVLRFTRASVNNTKFEITIIGGLNNTRTAIAKVLLSFGSNANDVQIAPIFAIASSANWSINIKVIRTSDSVDLWIREAQYVQYCAYCTVKYGQYVDVNSAITGLAVGDMATSSDPSNEPDTVATVTASTFDNYPIEV